MDDTTPIQLEYHWAAKRPVNAFALIALLVGLLGGPLSLSLTSGIDLIFPRQLTARGFYAIEFCWAAIALAFGCYCLGRLSRFDQSHRGRSALWIGALLNVAWPAVWTLWVLHVVSMTRIWAY